MSYFNIYSFDFRGAPWSIARELQLREEYLFRNKIHNARELQLQEEYLGLETRQRGRERDGMR